jgi:predicted tellurium resistance membrane protein TerC
MMELLTDPQAWIAFATLTALELVLGIDNIIFISILVDKLPKDKAGAGAAPGPVHGHVHAHRLAAGAVVDHRAGGPAVHRAQAGNLGARPDPDCGGLFLIWKSTGEIHQSMEGEEGHASTAVKATFTAVILQIMVVDMVFSLDSIITAVGMVDNLAVMIAAVIASVGLMMLFAPAIGRFVSDHPTIKMLALSFLVVVGVVLIAEGLDHHVPKGYVYFAMAFSVTVEMLNIRMRRKPAAGASEKRLFQAKRRRACLVRRSLPVHARICCTAAFGRKAPASAAGSRPWLTRPTCSSCSTRRKPTMPKTPPACCT